MRIGVAGFGAGGANALTGVPGLRSDRTVRLTATADPRPAARDQFERAWVHDESLAFSDTGWGRATHGVCLGILELSHERRELTMPRQTAVSPITA